MAYGLQVRTPSGLVDMSELVSTCRYLGVRTCNGASGSVTVPSGWSTSVGVFVPHQTTTSASYNNPITWSVSGTTLSWSGGDSSATHDVYFFLDRETSGTGGYGAWVKNPSGVVVLNDTNRPLAVKSSGTSTSSEKPSYCYIHRITADIDDLVLFDIGTVGYEGCNLAYLNGQRIVAHTHASIAYVIAEPNAVPAAGSSYGIEIRNSSGSRVFSDNMNILNVVDAGLGSQASWSRSVNSGTLYGYLASPVGVNGGSPGSDITCLTLRRNGAAAVSISTRGWNYVGAPLVSVGLSMPVAPIIAK